MVPPRSRLWFLDVVRGLGIILVVLMHAYFDPPFWATANEARVMHSLYFLGHTVVPGFFFISGYLYAREARRDFRTVVLRKARLLLIPTVLWSVIALTIRWKVWGMTGHQVVQDGFLFNAGGQYFYMPVLLLLFALTVRLRAASARVLAVLTAALLVAGLVRVTALGFSPPSSTLSAILTYRDPLIWATFFVAGLHAAKWGRGLSWKIGGLLAGCGGALFAAWFVQGTRGSFPDSYFSPFVYLFGFTLVLLVGRGISATLSRERPAVLAPLEFLGAHSFAIYLAHVPLFIGLTTDYWFPDTDLDSYARRVLFRFVIGLGGPVLLVMLSRALVPQRAAELFGFQGRPPRPEAPRRTPRPAPAPTFRRALEVAARGGREHASS
jgi:fucose 4-O-acetylase-like acetyltransferase